MYISLVVTLENIKEIEQEALDLGVDVGAVRNEAALKTEEIYETALQNHIKAAKSEKLRNLRYNLINNIVDLLVKYNLASDDLTPELLSEIQSVVYKKTIEKVVIRTYKLEEADKPQELYSMHPSTAKPRRHTLTAKECANYEDELMKRISDLGGIYV